MDNHQKNTENLAVLLMRAKESLLGFYRPVLHANGLTEQQWRVMRILAEDTQMDFQILADRTCLLRPSLTGILNRLESDSASTSAISDGGDRTCLLRPSLTGILNRLESMQLVCRRKPALDQRRLLVALTKKGVHLHGQIIGEIRSCEEEFAHAFGVKNQEKLILLLNKVKTLDIK